MSAAPPTGKVYLVGAGPGDPGLLTLRGREVLAEADSIFYDALCAPELLQWAKPGAQKIFVGKSSGRQAFSQREIESLLIRQARRGERVVRLKGGDPFLFGRGGEECLALEAAGVPFEVVPGITSALAAPAYAGIPLTHRGVASAVTIVTGHEDPSKPEISVDWVALGGLEGTKVILMGAERLAEISRRLLEGGEREQCPVAAIRWGTFGKQEVREGTLQQAAGGEFSVEPPSVIVVGEVVKLRSRLSWREGLPLHGQRIVVTRTRCESSRLGKRLRELGADVLEIPTIRRVPRPFGEEQRDLVRRLASDFTWILLTSPYGADLFLRHVWETTGDVRALGGLRIAAVGSATADAVRRFHLSVDRMPESYTTSALAGCFSAQEIRGGRFCLARSSRGNPELPEALRRSGAHVSEWVLYDTEPETGDPTGAKARFLAGGADWVLFASSSAVENWHRLALHPRPGAPSPRIVSIGPVTTRALKRFGLSVAAEAERHSVDGLVACLIDCVQKEK
ncbi:Uroporphyrinogen-III methylase and Uroporphyrinogen-III synthase [Methylacidimicrobium sp. AP8]|uniref:uroporphyrinogen-III C-methyltransferase n=1 Tax=Methylacidimicrobium sp. AP8 TaxID=2730359 RepID=UPI0018C03A92|nr:uroporphyrinogen-III C-methyltransferase [Methylacidimicrobium sp. AP8]CAB4242460.1 Uroporphyrinogen-III methylase and Uroporphyrinogen-III synthase [Methylacidimicrobium sp. AP8]